MPDYRLYRLDPHSGRFLGVEEIHASDDVSAVNESQQRAQGNAVELWEGGRRVTRIDAMPNGTAFAPSPEGRPLH